MTERTVINRGRRAGCAKGGLAALGFLLISSAVYLFATREPTAEVVSIAPENLAAIGSVSDRFLSYNIEMVEITGGRFWRPYEDGNHEGDDRYEYRPPIDLSDSRLVKLAAALGPAYVRFSGTWANATYFDPENTLEGAAPAGFDTVLTGEQWREAVEFTRSVDGEIVTSFATSPGVRDEHGVWQSEQAQEMIDFTQALGAEIAAAEYANEPETVELTQAPEGYTPADYRRDYARWHEFMREASPATLLMAPGAAELGPLTQFLRKWASGMEVFEHDELIDRDSPRPDSISFHFYGGGSQRCGEIPIGYDKGDAMSDRWLGLVGGAIATTSDLRDRIAPEAPLWLTETGETACGGNPWASTFLDTFRFTNQLALSAHQGVQVYIHNTLVASDYALLDEQTHSPRPNYWSALLWRNLMGTTVLDAGEGTAGLKVYAHCLRATPGGVALLVINHSENERRTVRLTAAGSLFSLRQGDTPDEVLLNGKLLTLAADDSLPALGGLEVEAGELHLPSASVNYLTFAEVTNPAC